MAPKRKAAQLTIPQQKKKVKRTQTQESQPSSSPLLRLPPELRNRIYEFSLIEGGMIEVTKDLKQPALLSTCRQIRSEVRKMWYKVNQFTLDVYDFDGELSHNFEVHARRIIGDHSTVVYIGLEGRKCWKNLLHWCKLAWNDEVFPLSGLAREQLTDVDNRSEWAVLRAAHRTVQGLRERGQSWEVCLEELEELRFLVGELDPDWLL